MAWAGISIGIARMPSIDIGRVFGLSAIVIQRFTIFSKKDRPFRVRDLAKIHHSHHNHNSQTHAPRARFE